MKRVLEAPGMKRVLEAPGMKRPFPLAAIAAVFGVSLLVFLWLSIRLHGDTQRISEEAARGQRCRR